MMKINLNSIESELNLQITGNEPWLQRIYEDFSQQPGVSSRITGYLKIISYGSAANVQGELQYAPFIACGRCARDVLLPLSVKVDARFLPEDESPENKKNWRRERNLSRADLDAYFIADGSIDLEELINDAINEEIPSCYVPSDNELQTCLVCNDDLDEAQVYGEKRKETTSAFEALKRLKLKH